MDIVVTALVAYGAGLGTAAALRWLRFRARRSLEIEMDQHEMVSRFDDAVSRTFRDNENWMRDLHVHGRESVPRRER